MLLYQHGYEVGKYISLEKIVEESKEDYYEALREASEDWHANTPNLLNWWNFFLRVIKTAYQELKDRVELSKTGDNQSSLVQQTILSFQGDFSISEIKNLLPSIDRELIKKVLSKMKAEKKIELQGKGRSARWKIKT